MPADQPYPAADWWRALVVFVYMTGWRIGDMMGLRRTDLKLATGTASPGPRTTRANAIRW
jgi:hypothetical protein